MKDLIKWVYRIGGTLLGLYIFVAMTKFGFDTTEGVHPWMLSFMGLVGGLIVVKNYWEQTKDEPPVDIYQRDPKLCYIVWCWEDVKTLRENWSDEDCQLWLEGNGGYLKDRSIELGWDVMEDLLPPKGEPYVS
jgi:hypothetical protein